MVYSYEKDLPYNGGEFQGAKIHNLHKNSYVLLMRVVKCESIDKVNIHKYS